jgi:uncharacterized protein DUF6029
MKGINITFCTLLLLFFYQFSYGQDVARMSGSLQAQGNFFVRDTAIGASNTPQYDHQLYGADTWLQLNYAYKGFDVGARFDLFNNSNLLDPQGSYTAQGIGRWYIKKTVHKLGISGGYLYDQIGSGIIFRAFEQRPLLIDNALYGIRLTYDLNEDWKLKAFTGKQKQQFSTYGAIIKGFSIDGFVASKNEEQNWTLSPGFGVVAKTLDDDLMRTVVSTINTYSVVDSIAPKYNTYAFSLYNTLNAGKFSWYVEGAYKTAEQFFDPRAIKTNRDSTQSLGKLVFEHGTVLYTSLSYADKGFGITLEAKRTENFSFRTSPFVTGNQGAINFLPPMTRFNTYRLTTRYQAATQELGENAFQADVKYAFNKKFQVGVNGSYITDLEDEEGNAEILYRELYTEFTYKYKRKWQITGGVQYQEYNQDRYEEKIGKDNVETITPYVDFLYKISRKKAIRLEAQYMNAEEDYGSWLFGLAEFTMAPHWTFTISDMYNVKPNPKKEEIPEGEDGKKLKIHYPRFDVFYTFKSNRFSLSYVKQVEGIVCTGGICRLEPAFSGVKLSVNSTF